MASNDNNNTNNEVTKKEEEVKQVEQKENNDKKKRTPEEEDVLLTTSLEKESLSYANAHDLLLLTSIKGPFLESEARETRAPIDLVAVIDKSGSMSGAKLELVLKTMTFVVDQLKAADQLSIVTYDTQVELPLSFTYMTAEGKKQANTILEGIKDGSSTNLSGGLIKAIEQVLERKIKNDVASIMLFTDGLANVGITKTPEIVKAINTNLAKIDSACSIFTFGYGSDHDEHMLREIADAGKGLYYFIETLDDIPKSFSDCLGGLLSVVAQNISLKLEGVSGITIKNFVSKIKGAEKLSGVSVQCNLGDIYSEEGRDIIVLVSVPAIEKPNDEFLPAVNITLSYFNVITSAFATKHATTYLKRPEVASADQPINLQIDKQRNRIIAAEAMEKASLLNKNDSSARTQAKNLLEAAVKTISTSATADDKFSKALVKDIKESISELQDEHYESAAVWKKMNQKGGCHSRQRGHFNDMYDNSDKAAMKLKAKLAHEQKEQQQQQQQASSSSSSSNNNNNNSNSNNSNNNNNNSNNNSNA